MAVASTALLLSQFFPTRMISLWGFVAVGALAGLLVRAAGGGRVVAVGFGVAAAAGPVGAVVLEAWRAGGGASGLPMAAVWLVVGTFGGFLVTAGLFARWMRRR